MAEVELVITIVPHDDGAPVVDGNEVPARRFASVDAAKAAADEVPVPDEWRIRESIRDVESGIELWWRTDRIPGWQQP